jgi:hypothetical protein
MMTANYLPAHSPLLDRSRGPHEDPNRAGVHGLLADADRTLALTDLEDVRGNREIVDDAIVTAHQNYIDLVRRQRRLSLTNDEHTAFQQTLDILRARLRFFGASL